MTITEQLNKANDRLAFVRNLASDAAKDINKSESLARMARQKLALSVMTAIDNGLIFYDVGENDTNQRRTFTRNSAVCAALHLFPACEAPDDGNYADMGNDTIKEWLKTIAEMIFPSPAWLPDSGFKKSEASEKQLHELAQMDKMRAATRRAAKFAFLLIARNVFTDDYNDQRGFAVAREYFFPNAIKFKGSLITNYNVVKASEPVYMTPGKFGMVKVGAELDLGSDGAHTYTINATVENFEKAAQLIKARSESDDVSNAFTVVAALKIDRKFSDHQKELLNKALAQLLAIKEAWSTGVTSVDENEEAA